MKLTLVSFPTCPFVQRAVIALREKGIDFDVIYVDLANKPDWFLKISPLGKVPLLKVELEDREPEVVFESAVILDYLEEALPGPKLYPEDPLGRARHRGWVEFASQLLGDLWKLTTAKSAADLEVARRALGERLGRLEPVLRGPFFAGESFGFVDSAFAPAFRQLDVLDTIAPTNLTASLPRVDAYRDALAERSSVRLAVPEDYAARYLETLRARDAEFLKQAA